MLRLIRLAVVLALMPIPVMAVTLSHLYQANMPVMSQSEDERSQAVRQAFMKLLIKLTGDAQIDKRPEFTEALRRADYYISDYSYSSPTPQSATYHLNINFEPTDVKRLLRRTGTVYWGENRPLIIVWLAVTNQENVTEIISSETTGDILDSMYHEGKKLALPIIFPLMDVADMSVVSPDEVSDMSIKALQKAGQRYSPNAYLIGKISPSADGFESEWELVLNKNQWKWNITDKSADEIIAQVLNQTNQTLMKYYRTRS